MNMWQLLPDVDCPRIMHFDDARTDLSALLPPQPAGRMAGGVQYVINCHYNVAAETLVAVAGDHAGEPARPPATPNAHALHCP